MTDEIPTPSPKRPARPRRAAAARTTPASKATDHSNGPTAKPAAVAKKAAPKQSASSTPAAAPLATAPTVEAAAATSEPLQLYLLRHADAGDSATWPGDDAERPLSPKGRRQARRLGRLLADLGFRPGVIVTSPKVRAAQTARIVGRALGSRPVDDLRLAGPMALADLDALLAGHAGARRIVLVGHDPEFSAFASSLSGAPIELRKGALARIDLPESRAAAGSGLLRWLIPPGALPG